MREYLSNPIGFSQEEKIIRPLHVKGAAGLDEAGRGCLAGPVVGACVCLPDNADELDALARLTDSKQLSEAVRFELEPEIKKAALGWSLGFVWPQEIDRINILQASLKSMSGAYASMLARLRGRNSLAGIEIVLIDGVQSLPGAMLLEELARWGLGREFALPQRALVKGDSRVLAIAAASVLAKTARDRFMLGIAKKYSEYGFERHKGYGTKAHLAAIKKYGTCVLHRRTFRGCCAEQTTNEMSGALCKDLS